MSSFFKNPISSHSTPTQPLYPYPQRTDQDTLVSTIWNIYSSASKIKNLIASPFQKIADLFSALLFKKDLTGKTFSTHHPLRIKTDTETFDQKCNYMIHEGKIYYRPLALGCDAEWQEIPFPKKAISISADGDNLIAVDEKKQIHYAKTTSIHFSFSENGWQASPCSIQWKTDWFNMILVAPFVNFLKPASLHAMEAARGVVISQRGRDALYYTDIGGKKHPEPFVGVTTLYMLNPSGTRIFFADPWLANKFHNEITTPKEGRFVAESMDASASTLFLLQRAKDAQGNEVHEMYTRYADFDSIGANPFLPATSNRANPTPLVRVLPGEDWLKQPAIPLEQNAHLTKRIAIVQTGRGQAQRQLRVEGTDAQGNTGYYVKQIYDASWSFERTNHAIPQEAFLPSQAVGNGLLLGPKLAHDYAGWIQTSQGKFHATLKKFSLQGFNEGGLHSSLEIQFPSGEKVAYPLYAKRGTSHLLGLNEKYPHWILVPPERTPLPIKGQRIYMDKRKEQILIKGEEFTALFSKNAPPHDLNDTESISPLPKPLQILIRGALPVLEGVKYLLKAASRLTNKLLNQKDALKAKERFFNSLLLGDLEDTKKTLHRLLSNDPSLAPEPLVDLLRHPHMWPRIHKLMHGANTLLLGDTEKLFQRLIHLEGARQRRSSHPHKAGTSYGLETPLFGELLFWKDEEGKLRMQFESHSLSTFLNIYYHFIDYLRYRLHNKQEGPYGVSKRTDAHPLVIHLQ
jgi:hypothetical protein